MHVPKVDAVVVGAGFAGLYSLYRLRNMGLSVRLLEAGDGVGGTWYWNRYPGARCDIESFDYSYSFSEELQQEWRWTQRYPSQPEILAYLEHVAGKFELMPDISLGTRVTGAAFDESMARWTVATDHGRISARFVVMATGCLSDGRVPDFPGRSSFAGQSFHTSRWPDEGIDVISGRVGVIGTGSSGVQVIPVLAEQVDQLYVFQRTPAYTLPAHNRPLTEAEQQAMKAGYADYRRRARRSFVGVPALPSAVSAQSALDVDAETRRGEYQRRWGHGGNALTGAFSDLLVNEESNATVAEFVRERISEAVQDPRLADKLSPTYPYGAKRPCIGTDYLDTFNRGNVELVDLTAEPLRRITPAGIHTERAEYPLDVIVYATGFDAFTGALSRIDIRGRGGATLAEYWSAGPRAYLGVSVGGFPNLFLITGPGSPSVLSNMVVSIEQHVGWIADLIGHMLDYGLDLAEPSEHAQNHWVEHCTALAKRTIFYSASSWYLGANVPGKPRVFMPYVGGVGAFRRHCDAVASNGYRELRFLGGCAERRGA